MIENEKQNTERKRIRNVVGKQKRKEGDVASRKGLIGFWKNWKKGNQTIEIKKEKMKIGS